MWSARAAGRLAPAVASVRVHGLCDVVGRRQARRLIGTESGVQRGAVPLPARAPPECRSYRARATCKSGGPHTRAQHRRGAACPEGIERRVVARRVAVLPRWTSPAGMSRASRQSREVTGLAAICRPARY
jgi:hypothetical protein